jgi:PAS domain S-box-containing protein/putative nucleotidyltransferase with HDIG domain
MNKKSLKMKDDLPGGEKKTGNGPDADLRELQSILTMAEEVAQIGSWRWDLRTQKVTWSEQMFRLFGVEQEGFDGDVNRVVSERIHPDDAAAVAESNRNVLENDNPTPLSYRIVLPDGTERTVWAQGKLIRNDAGQPVALTGYVQDITERVQAEKKILQMKRLYATLSQVNQTIVRVKDPLELYQSICDVAVKFGELAVAWIGLLDEGSGELNPVAATGMDLKNWPIPIININGGHHQNLIVANALHTSTTVTSEDVQVDERTEGLHELLRKTGFHSLASVPFRLQGKTIGVLNLLSSEKGFFNSADELRLLDEMGLDISFALDMMVNERIKRQWADAFEHCAHGIVIGNPHTNEILTCNPAFARLQGATVQELVSTPILNMYMPQDRERIKQFIDQSDRTGSVRFEAEKVRKGGSTYSMQMDLVSVRDENGSLLYRVATQQDITERKKAETALRESEERFRTAFDNMLEGVQIFDFDWRYVYLNRAAEIHNRRPNRELLGNIYMDMWAGIESTHVFSVIKRCMEERVPDHIENEFVYPDGVIGWFELSIQPVPEGVFILSMDITERKLAEVALKRNERVLRLFVEHSPASIAVFDLDMKYIVASHRYLVDYRLGEQDLRGRSHYEVFPEIPERWREIHRRCLAGAIEKAEEDPFPRADGHTDWVHWEIHPWYEEVGKIGGVILFSEVITERKQAHEALRESEALFSKVFQSSPIGINIFGLSNGRSAKANDAFLDIVEYSREEIIGHSAVELNLFADVEARNAWMKTLREGGVVRNQDAKIRSKSGKIKDALVSLDVIEINGERMVLVIASDITGRNRAQEALRVAEEKYRNIFEHAVEAITQTTPEGKYISANPATARMLGYDSPEDLIASLSDLDRQFYVEPGRRDEFMKLMRQHGAVSNFESEVYRKDGSRIWISEDSHAIYDEHGNLLYYEGTGQDVTERRQSEKQSRLQLERMQSLREIDRAISSSLDMRLSLDILLTQVLSQLGVDAAAVLLLNPSSQTLEYETGKGFRSLGIRESRLILGQGLAGQVGLERKLLHIPDLAAAGDQFLRRELLREENFIEYFGVPLIAKGMIKGVLEVFHRTPFNPDAEWVNFLETLGGQAAIALDNAQLFSAMQQSNLELITAYDATIVGWSRAMDLRDKETEGHTLRVTELAVQLAKRMGLNQADIVQLRRGALLHDIGKLGVPDHILHKPDKLDRLEWAIMRQHPTYAFNMLMPINYLRPALDIPYCHHEKWDGSGYPRGLAGEEIPLAARIFAIVDVWDALRSDRPYRAGWAVEKIREHLNEEAGTHFDPRVVTEFQRLLDEFPSPQ